MRMFVRAAVRIILVVLFLQTILATLRYITEPNIHNRVTAITHWEPFSTIIGAALISIGILALLWWRTDWLVRVLTGRVYDRELIISTSNIDLMKVAMRILGAYLIVSGIPSLIGNIGFHIALLDSDLLVMYTPDLERNLIVPVIQILIGFWLVLGTKGIVKTLNVLDDKVHIIPPEEKPE
jgi:hypothetical protein